MLTNKLSRREFLKVSASAAGTAVLTLNPMTP